MEKFDAKDLKILYELERDARLPASAIAKKVGLSKHAVLYRIAALEKQGVVGPYLTVTNSARFGFQNYEVWIRLKEIPPKELERMVHYLKNNPHVYWIASCTLSYDFSVAFMTQSVHAFKHQFGLFLEEFENYVSSYDVSVVQDWFNFGRLYFLGNNAHEPRRATYSFTDISRQNKLACSALDLRILDTLRFNARESLVVLTKQLGITEKTLHKRMLNLRKSGVITGFKAQIHPTKLGFEWFEVFVSIKKNPKREEALVRYCASQPHIIYCIRGIAKWDFDISIEAANVAEFQKIMSGLRDQFSDIILSYDTVAVTYDHYLNYMPPLLPTP